MDETGSAIGRSRSSFAQTDRYSGPRTLALCAGFGRTAADTLRLVIFGVRRPGAALACRGLVAILIAVAKAAPGRRTAKFEDLGNISEARSVCLDGGHFKSQLWFVRRIQDGRNGQARVHKTRRFGRGNRIC